MGIRIAHEPIAAPMIAAYSTGVGHAQERNKARAQEQMQQQAAINARWQMQAQHQGFVAEQNEINRANQNERDWFAHLDEERRRAEDRDADAAKADRQNEFFRNKEDLGGLSKEIEQRENWLRKTPLAQDSETQMWQADKVKTLAELRRQRANGMRDDEYKQHLSNWIEKFDLDNPLSRAAPQPDVWGDMGNQEGFIDPEGRKMSPEDVQAGKPIGGIITRGRDGARRLQPYSGGSKGKVTGPQPIAATPEEFFSDPLNDKWARDQAVKDLTTAEGGPPKDMSAIENRMRELYESRRRMSTPAAPPAEAAPAPAGQSDIGIWEGTAVDDWYSEGPQEQRTRLESAAAKTYGRSWGQLDQREKLTVLEADANSSTPQSAPPAPPTAVPTAAGQQLPADLSQVPQASWPDPADPKNVLVPDTKSGTWVQEKDPAKVKQYNMDRYEYNIRSVMQGKASYEELSPEDKVKMRQLIEGRNEVKGW